MSNLTSNFGTLDWAIVAFYLLGTVIIGLYANRYIQNLSDYIVAGRSLRSYLAIATMVGSELGLVTVMYSAQKGFTGGFAAFHIGLIGAGLLAAFMSTHDSYLLCWASVLTHDVVAPALSLIHI